MFIRVQHRTECLIDNQIIEYDACARDDKASADEFYKNAFTYIGSSHTYIINGTTNNSEELMHFYIYKK